MAHTIKETCELAEMEAECCNTVWLFTWNPSDKKVGTDHDYQTKWDNMITGYLKHFNRCMYKYCILPEISDAGRLHVHGWFVIKDKVKWVKSVKPRLQRSGRFKMSKKFEKCKKDPFYYYKKDIEDTIQIFPQRTLPIYHYNIKDVLKEIKHMVISRIKEKTQIKNVDITKFFNIE